jgi:hypothetical protein
MVALAFSGDASAGAVVREVAALHGLHLLDALGQEATSGRPEQHAAVDLPAKPEQLLMHLAPWPGVRQHPVDHGQESIL